MRIYEIDDSAWPQPPNMEGYVEHIKDLIWENCKPFLNLIDFNPAQYRLYRGDRKCPEFAKLKTMRNRLPKDTPQWSHELIDKYFLNEYGFLYRSQAVFATGSRMEASDYGPPFTMFPIGEFTFCYSPKCSDLFKYLDDTRLFSEVDKLINYDDDGWSKAYELVSEELSSLRYEQNTNMEYAIQSGNEIMINCAEYYMVNDHDFPIGWLG